MSILRGETLLRELQRLIALNAARDRPLGVLHVVAAQAVHADQQDAERPLARGIGRDQPLQLAQQRLTAEDAHAR